MASKLDKGLSRQKADLTQGAGDTKVAASLKIMIMNTGGGTGKNEGDNQTERRNQAIFDVVTHTKAEGDNPTVRRKQAISDVVTHTKAEGDNPTKGRKQALSDVVTHTKAEGDNPTEGRKQAISDVVTHTKAEDDNPTEGRKQAISDVVTHTKAEGDNPTESRKQAISDVVIHTKAEGDSPTERRKQAIFDVVTDTKSALTLFQEFGWTSIDSRGWNNFKWPKYYQYTGHKHASILYDVNDVSIEECTQTLLDSTLNELIRTGEIQSGFTPNPRMCLRKIKTKGVPIIEFICVSWHGRHNKAKLSELIVEFKSILKYILKLSEKENLPVIIAGDFNVKVKDIKDFVPPTLVLHTYQPTVRRKKEDIIDYFISSESLPMSGTKALSLDKETSVDWVLGLLDHDPVVSFMTTTTETTITSKKLAKT